MLKTPLSTPADSKRLTCPHCWNTFPSEQTLWISEHADLLGDSLLGPDHQIRFSPTRFNVAGDAIDARGFPCHQLACPKCHLGVARALVDFDPLFFSIFGAPASGKSFFLASMTWQLKQILSSTFSVSFTDADPLVNQILEDYGTSLFMNPQANEMCSLTGLIRKTEEQGELYDTVSYGSQTVSYPRPFLFTMQPRKGHPNHEHAQRLGRVVCLYDNAGESFQPGKDHVSNPVTRHLAQSRALFYLFDPTQDLRFRKLMSDNSLLEESQKSSARLFRQEAILQEAALRIRRHTQLKESEKHRRPLFVILTKYDAWSPLLESMMDIQDHSEPWKPLSISGSQENLHGLDLQRIERYAAFTKRLMQKVCPDVVAAAESFASSVTFLPSSAVGWCEQSLEQDGQVYIRPEEVNPFWVTVPFLYALARSHPGLIPLLKQSQGTV